MTSKKLWISSIILFIAFLIQRCAMLINTEMSTQANWFYMRALLQPDLIIITLGGITGGVLLALLPFREKQFKEKLAYTWPACTAVIILYLLLTYFVVYYYQA